MSVFKPALNWTLIYLFCNWTCMRTSFFFNLKNNHKKMLYREKYENCVHFFSLGKIPWVMMTYINLKRRVLYGFVLIYFKQNLPFHILLESSLFDFLFSLNYVQEATISCLSTWPTCCDYYYMSLDNFHCFGSRLFRSLQPQNCMWNYSSLIDVLQFIGELEHSRS